MERKKESWIERSGEHSYNSMCNYIIYRYIILHDFTEIVIKKRQHTHFCKFLFSSEADYTRS